MDETDTHRRSWTVDDALAERLAPWAIGGVALAVLSTAIATFQFIGTQDSGVGSGTDWFWTIFSSVATAAIAFGVLLEAGTRGAHLDSFAGWFGVLALASCAIFWSGVPVVLGFAAVSAGMEVVRQRTVGGERPRVAEAGIGMGALAVVLAFLFCLFA